jgi:hypothetical protein
VRFLPDVRQRLLLWHGSRCAIAVSYAATNRQPVLFGNCCTFDRDGFCAGTGIGNETISAPDTTSDTCTRNSIWI